MNRLDLWPPGALPWARLQDFEQVPDLGADRPVVLTVKAEAGGSYRRARYLRQRAALRRGEVFREMRRSLPGFIRFGALGELLSGARGHRLDQVGIEPYDFVSRGALGVFAFHDEDTLRIVDLSTGARLGSLREVCVGGRRRGLYNAHTLALHPEDPDRLLVAVTGLDRVIELRLSSGEVLWDWSPWEHGLHTNQHGLTLAERGGPAPRLPPGAKVRHLGFAEAEARVLADARPDPGEVWLHEVDLHDLPHRLGLLTWQRVKLLNSASYLGDGRVGVTFWQTGEVVCVDVASGEPQQVAEGLRFPHSLVPFGGAHLVTDTGGGRVLLLGPCLEPAAEVDFTACPLPPGASPDAPEWVQNTHPLDDELLVTFDFRRSRVVVWSPGRRQRSEYPVDPERVIQCIQPLHPSSLGAVFGG